MKICVLGAGAWGLAIADLLNSKNYSVCVWEFDPEVCTSLDSERQIFSKLPGYKIPAGIRFSNDLVLEADNAEIIVNAVPTQFIRSYFGQLKNVNLSGKIIVNVSKGIEVSTGMDISRMFVNGFPAVTKDNFVVLAGPSFAIEVALNKTPTAVVAACENIKTANRVRDIFSGPYFRVYSSDDVIGVETGGSVKNILAIAAGVIDGLGLGNNTKAAMLTRGLTEMVRFGMAQGAKRETFSGLSGIGDMILTCNSNLSRNYQVGKRLAKGENLDKIIKSMKMVAEGVDTCRIVKKIAEEKNISMPISFAVYEILFNGLEPKAGITDLMSREKKQED